MKGILGFSFSGDKKSPNNSAHYVYSNHSRILKSYAKAVSLILIAVLLVLNFISCSGEQNPGGILSDFLLLYGAEGIIYSSEATEAEEGFISEQTLNKLFVFNGDVPEDFALFLNSHPHRGSECGVFSFRDQDERQRIIESCRERISLLSFTGEGIVLTSGSLVFYSTMSDRQRVTELWNKIISAHS